MSRFDHFCVTFLSRACYLLVGALSCCGRCVNLEGWEVLQTGDLRINIEGQVVRRGGEYQTAAEIRAVRLGQVLQTGNTQDGQGKEQTCANAMVCEYSRYNDVSAKVTGLPPPPGVLPRLGLVGPAMLVIRLERPCHVVMVVDLRM